MTKVKSKQEIVDWLKESEKILHKLKKMLLEDNAKRKNMKAIGKAELYVFKPENNDGFKTMEYMHWQKLRVQSKVSTLKWVLGELG